MPSLIQPKLCCPILPCKKTRSPHSLQINAQIPRDHEGRSSKIVDANLHLLKVRIEEVRTKERLERCCVAERGWNYENYVIKRNNYYQEMGAEFLELLAMATSTLGFTIFSCTFCLCIISLLLHLS